MVGTVRSGHVGLLVAETLLSYAVLGQKNFMQRPGPNPEDKDICLQNYPLVI